MIVRRLEAVEAVGRASRLADVLPAVTADRLAAAAAPAVLIDEAPLGDAAALAAAIGAAGGVAACTAGGALVAAGTREQFLAARADRFVDALEREASTPPRLRWRERSLEFADEARVMGILNVTPDSFYERAAGLDDAIARARAIAAAGGALVDVGGQSYAHWNPRVAAEVERARVVPVVEAIRAAGVDVAISIDTFKADVAEAALAAGAHVINDCSGLSQPRLAEVVAAADAGLVVMHLKGELNVRDPAGYHYDDALKEIVEFLYDRTERARSAGVRRDAIAIDPGLEFGKEPLTDLEILERFGELRTLGYPILLASSRKSFIGRIFGRPAKELLAPSLATAGLAISAGARILRVHDVEATVQLARMYAAVMRPRRAGLVVAERMPGTPSNSSSGSGV